MLAGPLHSCHAVRLIYAASKKRFFFEKKKQKTVLSLRPKPLQNPGSEGPNFFGSRVPMPARSDA
jgi:hypothetical protein